MTVAALVSGSFLFASAVHAGNFSHIDVMDLGGRKIGHMGEPAQSRESAWFTSKVDITEDRPEFDHTPYLKPNDTDGSQIKSLLYRTDHTQFQAAYCWDPMSACGSVGEGDESYYLHFSEDTSLTFKTGETVKISGCPPPNPVAKSCRVQVFMWEDKRWVFNIKSSGWRKWRATTMINMLNSYAPRLDGVWLDEHLPGFRRALYILGQRVPNTVLNSGGAIREYNGLHVNAPNLPGKNYNRLDQEYNNDMISWFTYLKARLETAGYTYAFSNPATYFWMDIGPPLADAIGGISYELVNTPQNWGTTDGREHDFQHYIGLIKADNALGVKSDLYGVPGVYGPERYTRGNYDTAKNRYLMWRLAFYYLVRPVAAGIVFFDPQFKVDAANPSGYRSDWLPAFEWNIGAPVGDEYVFTTSSRPCAPVFKIWAREYSKGKIFVRPRDSRSCDDWDAGTKITVSPAMKRLNADGTFSAPSTTFTIRNAEALILAY